MRDYGRKSLVCPGTSISTDWVGGYPFEYTDAEAVIERLAPDGFKLLNIAPPLSPRPVGLRGTGSYQYLFQRE